MSDAVPGTLASFERDVASLLDTSRTASHAPMRLRWKRLYETEVSLLRIPMRGSESWLQVWLYPSSAGRRSRPTFNFLVDGSVGLDHVPQGCECTVDGELAVGRAVRVNVRALSFLSGTPLVSPLLAAFRGPRLGI